MKNGVGVARQSAEALEEVRNSDSHTSAREAGLRYVTDDNPGIRRKRHGRGYVYLDPSGKRITDEKDLERIKSIVIPPAWKDVWICKNPRGHIQATGRDDKGRKQYVYHERWQESRNETKFSRMIAFCEVLPKIREQVNADLRRQGLPREKVLATVVRLLEKTYIRVGNPEYARENNSFGLTTLRDRHVAISRTKVRFQFKGKSGKEHAIDLQDRRLARTVQRCKDIPGYHLFQYYDEEGNRQKINSDDVNEYLKGITGEDFTAKDFRTWAGTVLATLLLLEFGPCTEEKKLKKNIVGMVKKVAKRLGNTSATCRQFYIHPAILSGYMENHLCDYITEHISGKATVPPGLEAEEAAVLAFLKEMRAFKENGGRI